MKNNLIRFLLCAAAVTLLMPSLPFGVVQSSLSAQTTTTQTVLSAAITTRTQSTVTIASNTGVLASTGTQEQDFFIDGEMMKVQSQVGSTTTWNVSRGINRTRAAPHPTASVVYFGPAGRGPFVSQAPWPGSSCNATQYQFLPLIIYATAGPSSPNGNGMIANCVGSSGTTVLNGTWNITSIQPNNDLQSVTIVNDANYTATFADEFIIFQNGTAARTVTLPAITGLIGKIYVIAQPMNSPIPITVQTTVAQTIGSPGVTSFQVTAGGPVTRLISTLMGTSWIWATW